MRRRFMVVVLGGLWVVSSASGVEALFIDPTGGTTVSLGDDAESGAIGLGFTFPFFSDTFSETRIVSNGFLRFGTSPPTYYDNQALPQGVLVHIAPFWDDLAPNGGGTISYRGDATFFAATWDGVPLAYGGGEVSHVSGYPVGGWEYLWGVCGYHCVYLRNPGRSGGQWQRYSGA